MSNTYVTIRKSEFDSAMEMAAEKLGFSFTCPTQITREFANATVRTSTESEVVYIVPLGTTLDAAGFPKNFIKIYTSIPREVGRARPVGRDAIRVAAFMFGSFRKAMRVYRTEGWQGRVAERIAAFTDSYYLDGRADKKPCLIDKAPGTVEDFVSFLEGPTGHPGLTTKVIAAVDEALMNADFCIYCGSPDINGIIPGRGPACARHMDHVDGETVLSFFSVI
jgi:hypothetical protein